MALNPKQFWNSYKEALHAGGQTEPSQYPNGTTVSDDNGRHGTVTAQHQDRQHVNVEWKMGLVDVMHVDELH